MSRVPKAFSSVVGLLGVSFASVLLLSGCAMSDPHVRTGMSLADYGPYDLKPGDPAPDFVFVGDQENLSRFSAVRGRVTIVVFPTDAAWPNCATCRRVAELAEALSATDVDVVAVSVAQPARPAAEALSAVQACHINSDHLVTICDQHGRIKRLYGPQASGKFYVVNNYGRVTGVGPFSDLEALRAETRKTVRAVSDQDIREGVYE